MYIRIGSRWQSKKRGNEGRSAKKYTGGKIEEMKGNLPTSKCWRITSKCWRISQYFLHFSACICLSRTIIGCCFGSFKLWASFGEYLLFCRALSQKRPIILRSLLIGYKHPCMVKHWTSVIYHTWMLVSTHTHSHTYTHIHTHTHTHTNIHTHTHTHTHTHDAG